MVGVVLHGPASVPPAARISLIDPPTPELTAGENAASFFVETTPENFFDRNF